MSNLGYLMTQKFGLVNDLVGKGVCHQGWQPDFDYQNPHVRQLTAIGCPLTSRWVPSVTPQNNKIEFNCSKVLNLFVLILSYQDISTFLGSFL